MLLSYLSRLQQGVIYVYIYIYNLDHQKQNLIPLTRFARMMQFQNFNTMYRIVPALYESWPVMGGCSTWQPLGSLPLGIPEDLKSGFLGLKMSKTIIIKNKVRIEIQKKT